MVKTRADTNGVPKVLSDSMLNSSENLESVEEDFKFEGNDFVEFIADMLFERNDYKQMGKIAKGDPICYRDLQTLKNDTYINDVIINAYLQLVVAETNTPENATKVRFYFIFSVFICFIGLRIQFVCVQQMRYR